MPARYCVPVVSGWLDTVILSCSDELIVRYKDKNGPTVTLKYPGKGRAEFDITILITGRAVHRVYPYRAPYVHVGMPTCVKCPVSVGVSSNNNPSDEGESVTFTATITNTTGTVAPEGSVTFSSSLDGSLGSGSALTPSSNTATSTLTTSSLSVGTHTITATFTGIDGFADGSGNTSQTVNEAGSVLVDCCPDELQETLTCTLTNKSGLGADYPDSFEITWNGVATNWNTISGGVGGCTDGETNLNCMGTDPSGFLFTLGGNQNLVVTPISADCDPFELVFDCTFDGCTSGTGSCTVTITP